MVCLRVLWHAARLLSFIIQQLLDSVLCFPLFILLFPVRRVADFLFRTAPLRDSNGVGFEGLSEMWLAHTQG